MQSTLYLFELDSIITVLKLFILYLNDCFSKDHSTNKTCRNIIDRNGRMLRPRRYYVIIDRQFSHVELVWNR